MVSAESAIHTSDEAGRWPAMEFKGHSTQGYSPWAGMSQAFGLRQLRNKISSISPVKIWVMTRAEAARLLCKKSLRDRGHLREATSEHDFRKMSPTRGLPVGDTAEYPSALHDSGLNERAGETPALPG
jgi:hypothetical protein